MNIEKFKHQHVDILSRIDQLRSLTHAGVEVNAAAIAQGIISFSSLIKLHLAVEDKALYPALQRSGDATLARLGQQFQDDMGRLPKRLMALPAAGTRLSACAATRKAFATMPIPCSSVFMSACSGKTASSTRALKRRKPTPWREVCQCRFAL